MPNPNRPIGCPHGTVAGVTCGNCLRLAAQERTRLDALAGKTKPVPAQPKPKRTKPLSRAARWAAACEAASAALQDLVDLQIEYQDWLDNLPENFQQAPVGEKLQAVCDLDLQGAMDTVSEAEGADLPQGFGRD